MLYLPPTSEGRSVRLHIREDQASISARSSSRQELAITNITRSTLRTVHSSLGRTLFGDRDARNSGVVDQPLGCSRSLTNCRLKAQGTELACSNPRENPRRRRHLQNPRRSHDR